LNRLFFYPLHRLPTLVIGRESGVEYWFQVGGSACWKRHMEGAIYPLVLTGHRTAGALGDDLHELMYELVGMDSRRADLLDDLLGTFDALGIKVDRTKLDDSCDQWVHVLVEHTNGPYMQDFELPLPCVLAW
jgi:hypothetical protein